MREAVVVTCEHAGNRVPPEAASCFASSAARRALRSHRGWDRGALDAALSLADAWGVRPIVSEVSRLVVELNRSAHHPRRLSEFTLRLPAEDRDRLIARYWAPYRGRVERSISRRIDAGARVVHVSVHTFAPVLRGVRRNADVGLLYDSRRTGERELCGAWARRIRAGSPGLRVRRNYPYRGAADGFTTHLRRRFPERRYLGIEIEFNRALFDRDGARTRAVIDVVADTLRRSIVEAALTGRRRR